MQAVATQTWDATAKPQPAWLLRCLPSLTDLAFVLPLFLLYMMLPGTRILFSDGDTGWHLRTGDWILQHGWVPTADPFSFTMAGKPWFAWEWGWDVIFALVHRAWGLSGVALVTSIELAIISVLLYRLIRRTTDNDIVSFLFTMLAVCGSVVHWLARPHLISWTFLLVFAHIVLSAERGNRRLLAFTPIIMLLWVNLHGAFFTGIILLITSAVGEFVGGLASTQAVRDSFRRTVPFLAAAAACAAVTLVNPYTWHLHEHIASYVRDKRLLDNISEFRSVDFHNGGSIFFECMLILGIGAAFWSMMNKGRVSAALTILFWAHLALMSARNVPIFVLMTAPCAAAMTLAGLRWCSRLESLKNVGACFRDITTELRPIERVERLHFASVVAVGIVTCGLALGRPGFAAEFNPERFPLQAMSMLDSLKPKRIFTSDQWADYLIYRNYPKQRVYMDGRSDFFGYDTIRRYQHTMTGDYAWEKEIQRYGIDLVLVKPDGGLATVLKQSPKWRLVFDDGSAIIFQTRSGGDGLTEAASSATKIPLTRVSEGRGLGQTFVSANNQNN